MPRFSAYKRTEQLSCINPYQGQVLRDVEVIDDLTTKCGLQIGEVDRQRELVEKLNQLLRRSSRENKRVKANSKYDINER